MSGIINQIGARSKIVSGKVGIGTAAPSKKLHVEGAVAGDYAALIKSTHATSGFGLQIQAGDSNSEKNLTLQDKDGSDTHLFYAGGNATFTGNLVIGTNGKGIDFSANTDDEIGAGSVGAEILDDYEEGTWIGVVYGGANAMTMSGGATTGYYTKVGNLVTVSGYFGTTSLGSATGDIRITGLPFAIYNNASAYSGGGVAYGNDFNLSTAGDSVSYWAVISSAYMILMVWDATTGETAMQASEWTASGKIMMGFSYRAVD